MAVLLMVVEGCCCPGDKSVGVGDGGVLATTIYGGVDADDESVVDVKGDGGTVAGPARG